MRTYMHTMTKWKMGMAFGLRLRLYIRMTWGSVGHTVSKQEININTIYALPLQSLAITVYNHIHTGESGGGSFDTKSHFSTQDT
jgi:hypothetical protein